MRLDVSGTQSRRWRGLLIAGRRCCERQVMSLPRAQPQWRVMACLGQERSAGLGGSRASLVILGPSPAPHAKARGRYCWQILVKSDRPRSGEKCGLCGLVRSWSGSRAEVVSGSILMSIRFRWRDAGQRPCPRFFCSGSGGSLSGGGCGAFCCSLRRLKSPKAKVTQKTEVNSPKITAFRIAHLFLGRLTASHPHLHHGHDRPCHAFHAESQGGPCPDGSDAPSLARGERRWRWCRQAVPRAERPAPT
jgi:hypothetical protein